MTDKEQVVEDTVDMATIMDDKEQSNEDTVEAAKITTELSSGDTVDSGKFPTGNTPSSSAAAVQNSEDESRYRTDYPNVGVCFIINNETFDPFSELSSRMGTNKDEEAVKKTFESLGYNIIVHRNLTKKQMKQELEKVSNEDHSENASFVCVILTHGNKKGICGTDKTVQLEALTRYFKGEESKTLTGKPKLFFLQACRGEKLDAGMDRDMVDATPLPITQKIPVEADFLYAYATAPEHYAWRSSENGSWFIQSLCEILPKYKHLELMQILTRVNRKVALDFESSHTKPRFNGKKAVPCITSMLTKEFYFPK